MSADAVKAYIVRTRVPIVAVSRRTRAGATGASVVHGAGVAIITCCSVVAGRMRADPARADILRARVPVTLTWYAVVGRMRASSTLADVLRTRVPVILTCRSVVARRMRAASALADILRAGVPITLTWHAVVARRMRADPVGADVLGARVAVAVAGLSAAGNVVARTVDANVLGTGISVPCLF